MKLVYKGFSFCKVANRMYDVEPIYCGQVASLSSAAREFVSPYLIPMPTRKEEGFLMQMKVSVIATV